MRQMTSNQHSLALVVVIILVGTPLACIIHCHLLQWSAPSSPAWEGPSPYICHQPAGPQAPPSVDPALLQRLSEGVTDAVHAALPSLGFAALLVFTAHVLHTQVLFAPPTPPP
jgi:hypothetical protein